ncbi:MAG TPA: hypothetical protein VM098_03445 [Phycisphaerae bacterium]|nr:hypothetical protein [Phycisphaerae bacterium]
MSLGLGTCLMLAASRAPDRGPIYVETHLDRLIAEPWNAATAALFLVLAGWWLVKLRGRYRRFAFLTVCMFVLIVGGVGGTVYHAFRSHRAWLFMDFLPIVVLAVGGAVWLWLRALRPWWLALLVVAPFLVLPPMGFRALPRHMAINFGYSAQALLVLVPAVIVLVRTRGAHWPWPVGALACFVLALSARAADAAAGSFLPMGSHWLWHVFGAGTAHCMSMYIYRLTESGYAGRPAATSVEAPAPGTIRPPERQR